MSVNGLLVILFVSIALIVFLTTRWRVNAFMALIIACLFLGLATGMPVAKILQSIEAGLGSTLGFIATILGFGTILGKMLEVSGGAERLARTLINAIGEKRTHWAMMIVGFVCGIPVFFQVGLVLLMPILFSVARQTGMSVVKAGLPLVVGLGTVHCVLPPHPAAMAITGYLHADVGRVILLGLCASLPAAIVGGPLWSNYIGKRVHVTLKQEKNAPEVRSDESLPGFGITLGTVMLPMIFMIIKTVLEVLLPKDAPVMVVVNFFGHPVVALLISAIVSYFTLGFWRGFDRKQISKITEECFGPVASLLLVIGAGGAFNKVLVDSGMGSAIAKVLTGMNMDPLLMAWSIALVLHFCIGSATVSMMTAAGIMLPMMPMYPGLDPALIAVAIGGGALGLSHVTDSGFWFVKECLGMSVEETLKTYTLSVTIASVCILLGISAIYRLMA